VGVPALGGDAVLAQPPQVVPLAAAVVEQATRAVQQAVAGQGLDGGGEAVAGEGGAVAGDACEGLFAAGLAGGLFVADGDQLMPHHPIAALGQQRLPGAQEADAVGVVEQADLLRRGGEGAEYWLVRVVGREQQLLAVEDGRVEKTS
jgi:hypothetical protein